jgi:ribonuclease HI
MTFTIFADAAWHIERGAAFAFVIISPNGNIYKRSGKIKVPCHNPTEAELMAMGYAVHCIANRNQLTEADCLLVYTDCKPAIDYLSRKYAKNLRLVAIVNIIIGMTKGSIFPTRATEANEHILWCDSRSKLQNKKP